MAWMRFRKRDMPGGLWSKCPQCEKMLYKKDLDQNARVCTECDYHFPLSVDERVQTTLDEGSFTEIDSQMTTVDALGFIDSAPYPEKLEQTRKKTGRCEGMVYGTGRLRGREVVFGALEFAFLGGSMGVVVGEKVTRAAELALERKLPLILCSRSGGARMHEGALSLMQMAKTAAALARLNQAGGLYISLLAHPTTGGVTASWAMLADFILAEPKALIGFAGPRVIQNTIRQELPDGFQTAEFLLERGQLDRIVPRTELADVLDRLLSFCLGDAGNGSSDKGPPAETSKVPSPPGSVDAAEGSLAEPSANGKARAAAATREARRKAAGKGRSARSG